jgi:hypothetical protein
MMRAELNGKGYKSIAALGSKYVVIYISQKLVAYDKISGLHRGINDSFIAGSITSTQVQVAAPMIL